MLGLSDTKDEFSGRDRSAGTGSALGLLVADPSCGSGAFPSQPADRSWLRPERETRPQTAAILDL